MCVLLFYSDGTGAIFGGVFQWWSTEPDLVQILASDHSRQRRLWLRLARQHLHAHLAMKRLQITLITKTTFSAFHTFLADEIIAGAVPGVRPEVLRAGIFAAVLRNRNCLLLKLIMVGYGRAIVHALDVF